MDKKVCSFFGHRDAPFQIAGALEAQAKGMVEAAHGGVSFYVGGYGAFDHMAASVVRKIKKEYPAVELVLITAYLSSLERRRDSAEKYDAILYPSGLETVPQRFAITHRNRWMVNNSDFIIAYINRGFGGASDAVKYAVSRQIPVIRI